MVEAVTTQARSNSVPIDAEMIRAKAHADVVSRTPGSPFKTQTPNAWMRESSERPSPKRLLGDLWLEGDLVILFGDTGKGKTIFAVQAADAIASGNGMPGFACETGPQKVLYFDFELTDKQFEIRYSVAEGDYNRDHYVFSENFQRSEIDPDQFEPNEFSNYYEYLSSSVEAEIVGQQAKVVVIDNITALRSGTETAKDALPLMKELNRIKKKYRISLMVMAHTPKRDMTRPITINDLQGSKMLANFSDAIVAVGESVKDEGRRYVKQVKVRNGAAVYTEESVAVFQVEKPGNFLHFDFLGCSCEREHLNVLTDAEKADKVRDVLSFARAGLSQREIAERVGMSLGWVNKIVNSKRSNA